MVPHGAAHRSADPATHKQLREYRRLGQRRRRLLNRQNRQNWLRSTRLDQVAEGVPRRLRA
jgi:hypothetical protein